MKDHCLQRDLHGMASFLSLYQCLVEEGQLSQQFVHPGLDGCYITRRCHCAHINNAVIQEYLHSKQDIQKNIIRCTERLWVCYKRLCECVCCMLLPGYHLCLPGWTLLSSHHETEQWTLWSSTHPPPVWLIEMAEIKNTEGSIFPRVCCLLFVFPQTWISIAATQWH